MTVFTYEFQEKDGITLLTGKEELSQPLDKSTFDDASAGWASALKAIKEIGETYSLLLIVGVASQSTEVQNPE